MLMCFVRRIGFLPLHIRSLILSFLDREEFCVKFGFSKLKFLIGMKGPMVKLLRVQKYKNRPVR